MTTEVAVDEGREVLEPLHVLIPRIKENIMKGDAAGLEYYRLAGKDLIAAKKQLAHGQWGPWLKKNFNRAQQTANGWMRLAAAMDDQNEGAPSFSTLSQFVRPNSPRAHANHASWYDSVRDEARADKKAQNARQEAEEKERRLVRLLGLKLIRIGFQVLSKELHPDKGGSKDAQARLNEVRRLLVDALPG